MRVPVIDGADIRFRHVSLEPSTVRGIVNRIVQDDRGFLWFGTNHGLLRYDGYQFRAFVPDLEDPDTIRGTNVLAMSKDRSGRLWVGSGEHVDRYDPVSGVFQHVLPDLTNACEPAGIVRDIAQDGQGFVWVATDNGLVRLDPSNSKTTCYRHSQGDESSLGSSLIKAILESRDGSLWVATSIGLDELNRTTGRVKRHVILRGPSGAPLSLEGNKITLFQDHAGVFWISIPAGQETGLMSFDALSSVQSAYLFGSGPAETAFSLLEDEEQTLWFGVWQQGIFRFDRERKRAVRYYNHQKDRSSLSPGSVISLFRDRERRVWAGFDPPVVDFFNQRPPPFQIYRHDPSDPDNLSNAVVSALEDSRGILWVGRLSGLDRVDRRTGQVTRFSGKRVSGRLILRTVHAIAEDRRGYLWFGEWGNGLDRFDPRTGSFRFYNHDPHNSTSLSNDIVQSLYVDNHSTLWVGSYNALDCFDPKTEQFRAYQSPVPGSSQYRAITEDSSGALWLASLGNGLHRFDPLTGKFTIYRKQANDPQSLSNDIVNAVHVDRSGTIWAGTSDGLCGLDQKSQRFSCYYAQQGLASSVVEGILEDKRGDLWLSTSDGLSRFNPRTRTFRNYYAEDGLPSNEFRFAAVSRSAGGEMFFGSTSGLVAFSPERVIDDPFPPAVVLTDVWLLGTRLRAGENPLRTSAPYLESLTLGPRQNIFSFEFSALSYSNPSRNRYRYRLEGLEGQWNERDSSQRLVTYTTLPPGEYVFRVKAISSAGVSNENGTSVRIRILPPWWNTWWFRVVSVAAVLALLWAVYRIRVGVLERHQQLLERHRGEITALNERLMKAQEEERTRIAGELHDGVLQQITSVSLLLGAVKLQVPPELEAKEKIRQLQKKLIDVGTDIRQLSHELHPATLQDAGLPAALCAYCDEFSKIHGIPVSCEADTTVRDLSPGAALCIYRIAQEALGNVAKHSKANKVEVRLTRADGSVRLSVSDDGAGFASNRPAESGGLGLINMRERVRQLHGTLDFESEPGRGTTVRAEVPFRPAA